jgi:hypothetical protein
MRFVATFSTVRYTEDPNTQTPGNGTKRFIVDAESADQARRYAERFQRIALYMSHGISNLLTVEVATSEDVEQLELLSQYESQFPDR